MLKQSAMAGLTMLTLTFAWGAASAQTVPPAQKSLFREGPCGGILCDAVGGPQAPVHTEPPPPCGGGILCDMMPYAMGAPAGTRAAAGIAQPVATAPAAMAEAPVASMHRASRHHHARKAKVAKADSAPKAN